MLSRVLAETSNHRRFCNGKKVSAKIISNNLDLSHHLDVERSFDNNLMIEFAACFSFLFGEQIFIKKQMSKCHRVVNKTSLYKGNTILFRRSLNVKVKTVTKLIWWVFVFSRWH